MYKAIILVGGKGTRLQPLTEQTPKPLVDIGGTPQIVRQIEWLRHHGIRDIVLATGYLRDQFFEYLGDGSHLGVNIQYVAEEEPLGTAGAARLAWLEACQEPLAPVVVLNGDIVCDIDLSAMIIEHRKKGASITIAGVRVDDPSSYGTIEHNSCGWVEKFKEKVAHPKTNLINAGVYVVQGSRVFYSMAPGYTMFETNVFPVFAEQRELLVYEGKGYWNDVGTLDRYWETSEKLSVPQYQPIKFGVGGWESIIGRPNGFTLENVDRVAVGVARYTRQVHGIRSTVYVYYDKSPLAAEFAERIAQVLAERVTVVRLASVPCEVQDLDRTVCGNAVAVRVSAGTEPATMRVSVNNLPSMMLRPSDAELIEKLIHTYEPPIVRFDFRER